MSHLEILCTHISSWTLFLYLYLLMAILVMWSCFDDNVVDSLVHALLLHWVAYDVGATPASLCHFSNLAALNLEDNQLIYLFV